MLHGVPPPPFSPPLRALVSPFLGVQEKSEAGPCTPVEREPPIRGPSRAAFQWPLPCPSDRPGTGFLARPAPLSKVPRRRPIGRNREGGCVRPMGRLPRAGVAPQDLGALGPDPGHFVFPSPPSPPGLGPGTLCGQEGRDSPDPWHWIASPVREHPFPILPITPFF